MNKPKVLIFGSSGHARVVIDIIEKEGKYTIVGLLDSFRELGEETLGYKVIGKKENIPELLSKYPKIKLFIAIGDNWDRNVILKKILALAPKVEFATTIHPSAQIGKNVTIGNGVVFMPGVIVNSNTQIGNFVVLNTNTSIGHDNLISDFSSLGPKVATGGNVTIGTYSAVTIGATIINKLSVGEHAIIGAGALLTKNCGNNKVMYGVPAKVIRNRQIGEKYIH